MKNIQERFSKTEIAEIADFESVEYSTSLLLEENILKLTGEQFFSHVKTSKNKVTMNFNNAFTKSLVKAVATPQTLKDRLRFAFLALSKGMEKTLPSKSYAPHGIINTKTENGYNYIIKFGKNFSLRVNKNVDNSVLVGEFLDHSQRE